MAASKKPAKKAPAKKAAGVVFDVAHPKKGALNTSSTTRPVIITNRPIIKDDVVNEQPVSAPVLTHPKKVVIMPLSEDVSKVSVTVDKPTAPDPKPEPAETPATAPPEVPKPEPEPVPEPVTEPEPAVEPAPKPEPAQPIVTTAAGKPIEDLLPQKQVAVPAAQRDDKQLSPQQAEEALRLSQERAARLQHMIEAEQYFLPINAVQERRSRNFAIGGLVLVIILAAAWYDVALDANLIPNSFNLPHTHFFSIR